MVILNNENMYLQKRYLGEKVMKFYKRVKCIIIKHCQKDVLTQSVDGVHEGVSNLSPDTIEGWF